MSFFENTRKPVGLGGKIMVAMMNFGHSAMAEWGLSFLQPAPDAMVLDCGCGLDNTGRACDTGRCKIYNLDFPDVIAVRQQLLPAGEREQNIPCDLKDPAWFDRIDATGGAVFFASGGLYCDCGYKKKGYRKTISHLPRSAEQEPHAQQERKEGQVG